jgi:ethanolamine kinase
MSKSSAQDAKTVATVNAITRGKATPNIWTVMQKWILALPSSTEAEVARNTTLQKELERTVKDLGDRPGLGKDGVWSYRTVNVVKLTDKA